MRNIFEKCTDDEDGQEDEIKVIRVVLEGSEGHFHPADGFLYLNVETTAHRSTGQVDSLHSLGILKKNGSSFHF